MKKKINVLFVCIANSCRSQMAEALFNKLVNDYDVDAFATSAGTVSYTHLTLPTNREV